MYLADWLDRYGWTDVRMADICGVNSETIRLLRHGRRKASEKLARKIEKVTEGKVTLNDLARCFDQGGPPARKPTNELRPYKNRAA